MSEYNLYDFYLCGKYGYITIGPVLQHASHHKMTIIVVTLIDGDFRITCMSEDDKLDLEYVANHAWEAYQANIEAMLEEW